MIIFGESQHNKKNIVFRFDSCPFIDIKVQLVPAAAATAGLYLLARSISAIQAIAGGPLAEPSLPQQLARWSVDAVALLLPRLDAVTRTDWLIYGPPTPGHYAMGIAGLAIYALLLVAAGLFDFHRRNL